jgi:hypothetical protein
MESGFGYGYATPEDWSSDYAAIRFMILRALARWRTCTLVQVSAVQPGAIGPIGTVTVQPLVNMVDGQGNATQYPAIPKIPYLRIGGGRNAVICDPAQNDIGVMVVADRDISAVKNSQKTSTPGSGRRADLADGIYLGTILSTQAPVQYVQFTSTGINIVDINGNQLISSSTGWTLTGNLNITGQISATGDVIADSGANFVSLVNHLTTGVTVGSPTTLSGPPKAGT